MSLPSIHQVIEIVLLYILTIALALLLLIWLFDLCLYTHNLYRRTQQQQQGTNNEIANDHEARAVGAVDNIHELFLKLWEDLRLWVQPQTPRRQREEAIAKFPPPEKYDIDFDNSMEMSSNCCAICLEDFVRGDLFRVLPLCKHVYHSECINRWFLDELRCPICRSSI
ncbi:RING-H2 finger protein [Melia azedarach]|uniref:RING-H2 finger protein n=1 Tax=Melia azedarach TaxID=155640 RepID=A0ACC1YYW4_MELAZ|nr:RING-H2 finger protein [Melia azedarach]